MTPDTRNDILIPRRELVECQEQLAAADKTIAGLQNTISRLEAEIKHLNAANQEAYQRGDDAGESTWRRNLREQRLD